MATKQKHAAVKPAGRSPKTPPAGLVRAVELWEPRGDRLTITAAIHRDTPKLAAASETSFFKSGEGLPGRVFESQTPVVFADLEAGEFVRSRAAAADGLKAGIGVPVLRGGEVKSVVVLMFGGGESAVGAVESWVPVPHRGEVTLGTSYYAGLPRFEKISRHVQFPRGSGLPGGVWEAMSPTLLTGLSRSKDFIRAAGAGAEGISSAVAWPVSDYADRLTSVCVLLSAGRSPLARVMQLWTPHETHGLVLTRTDARTGHALREVCAAAPAVMGEGVVGRAWQTNTPVLCGNLPAEDDAASKAAVELGLTQAVALPVHVGETLRGVIALWN